VNEGFALRALTRGRVDGGVLQEVGATLVPGNLDDANSLAAAVDGVEVVVHVAGLIKARTRRELDFVNALGTERLLRACMAARPMPRRLVLVSSQAAQGPSPDRRPVAADAPLRPVSHYGRSKARAERLARVLGARAGIEVVIVRPPAVYGPRDRETLEFFLAARSGMRLRLAGRDLLLSLVHVEDLARGLVAAATVPAAAGRAFHLCHGEVLRMGGVLDLMARSLGVKGRAVALPRAMVTLAGFAFDHAYSLRGSVPPLTRDKAREITARCWLSDPGSAREVLGWEARIPAAEGIPSTANWYRNEGWL
jgi:nucleoside-diphosphate-sugar epimerase